MCLPRQPGATPTGNNSLEAVTPGAADHVNHLVLVDHRFDLACQLCSRPLLDTSLGLNFSLVLQGLLCNVLLASWMLQPALQDSHRSRLAMPPAPSQ